MTDAPRTVTCFHLVDGSIVLAVIAGEAPEVVDVFDPLIVTKYSDDYSTRPQIMLSRYNNFGSTDEATRIWRSGIVSTYTLNEKNARYYEDYVTMYFTIAEGKDGDPMPDVPADPKTVSGIMDDAASDGQGPIDIEKLRRDTIQLVWSKKDED